MPSLSRLGAVVALSALAIACGARTRLDDATGASTNDAGVPSDDAGPPFPVGTYTQCAFGTVATGPLLIPGGFDTVATLTVTESGDARMGTFVDDNGTRAWSFNPTTSVSSTLAPIPQRTRAFGSSICVYGIGVSNENFFPMNLDATSGAMTYASGAVFIALRGKLTSQTDCGDVSIPASVWIGCTGGPAPAIRAAVSSPPFPVGAYACTSQVGTHWKIDGKNAFTTSGGAGELTLTQTGPQVTARYAADAELNGAFDLTLNAAATATAVGGQTLTARCQPDPTTGDLAVTAASLTADDGTVFLSFTGTMSESSACPAAEKIATLVCTKK